MMRKIKSKSHIILNEQVRSLLEKRWLLFFKALGVKFEYEPERFPDGISNIGYLPDILIHKKLYLEIKPSIEIARAEMKRPYGFVRSTGKRLFIVIGDPPGDIVIAIYKAKNEFITYSYIRNISWKTMTTKSDIEYYQEKTAAMSAINHACYSMATPLARCLDNIKQQ